jgi:hypothetical protein
MLASQNASAFPARSSVRASTSAFSRGQLANPYLLATASCAAASVSASATPEISSTEARSPPFAARSNCFAWRRRLSTLGWAGSVAMTLSFTAWARVPGARRRSPRPICVISEVDFVLPADPEAPSRAGTSLAWARA